MRLLESHSIRQIADRLGVSRGAVYYSIHRARRAFEKAGYSPPAIRQHSKREKLPMQNAATAEGAIAPAKPAMPRPTDSRMRTSYSMWSLFRNCRRAARFRYLDRIVPIERNPNLAFGSLIHECLETWHRDRDLEAVLEQIDTACAGRHASEDERRDWHCARAMMTGYAKAYPTEEFEVVALEHVFDADIVNPKSGATSRSFTISGKVDGIVRMDGKYFLLEHKTAAQLGGDYLERLWCDLQIRLYSHFVEQTSGTDPRP